MVSFNQDLKPITQNKFIQQLNFNIYPELTMDTLYPKADYTANDYNKFFQVTQSINMPQY